MKLNKPTKPLQDGAALLASFAVFFCAFYVYFMGAFSRIDTDIPSQLEGAVNGEGYSLISLIFRLLYTIVPSQYRLSSALFLAVCTVLTIPAIAILLDELLKQNNVSISRSSLLLLSSTAVFLASVFLPRVYPHFYHVSTAITQPWHNATYIGMRLTATMTLVYFFRIYSQYKQRLIYANLIRFTVFLTLTNAIKSNFLVSFSPVMLLLLIYDFIASRGKTFRNAFIFGCCVLVSLLPSFLQAYILFGPSTGDGIRLCFDRVVRIYSANRAFFVLLCNFAFPLFVTGLLFKKRVSLKGHINLGTCWGMVLLSRLTADVFEETGLRAGHGNFAWGEYYFSLILFIASLGELISLHRKGLIGKTQYRIGLSVYLIHFASGIIYYFFLLFTKGYLI